MDTAQIAPQTVIVAEDEATLYLQATTRAVWAPRGQTPHIRVHPKRDKVSFYGTLDLHTGRVLLTQEAKLTSAATARHLQTLLAAYPDKPILLLWDRASWHGGAAVQAVLHAHPRLELLRLPTAAPDLNPQEQVWKATRWAISHNHDHLHFAPLAERFAQHLTATTFACSLLAKHNYPALCATFT